MTVFFCGGRVPCEKGTVRGRGPCVCHSWLAVGVWNVGVRGAKKQSTLDTKKSYCCTSFGVLVNNPSVEVLGRVVEDVCFCVWWREGVVWLACAREGV